MRSLKTRLTKLERNQPEPKRLGLMEYCAMRDRMIEEMDADDPRLAKLVPAWWLPLVIAEKRGEKIDTSGVIPEG